MRETEPQNSERLNSLPEDTQLVGGGTDFEPSLLETEPKLLLSSLLLLS